MSDQEKKPVHTKYVWYGIGLCAALHLLHFIYPIAVVFIGISQLVYIIPAILITRKQPGIVQGLIIGAAVTFLLNIACFGIVIATF